MPNATDCVTAVRILRCHFEKTLQAAAATLSTEEISQSGDRERVGSPGRDRPQECEAAARVQAHWLRPLATSEQSAARCSDRCMRPKYPGKPTAWFSDNG